jgi:DNA invertase Pin-like site-specific DNA recombinase
MHNNFKKIYIYTRVSTRKQSYDNHNGLHIQYTSCSEYTLKNYKKHKNIFNFIDIGSSYDKKNILTKRNKLLKESINNSLVIIYDISRIGRNTIDTIKFLEKIKQKDIMIHSVKDNLTFNKSKLMDKDFYRKVIDSENNSDLKSIAVKKSFSDIKNKGGHIGKAPFGYYTIKINNIRHLKEDSHEQEMIKLINKKIRYFSRHCKNPYSKTAEYLNDESLKYKNKPWNRQNVKYVINLSLKYINHSVNI